MSNDMDELTLPVNVMIADDASVRTLMLRLKRMIVRDEEGESYLSSLMTSWYHGRGYSIEIPVPDSCELVVTVQTMFNADKKEGELSLVVNFPEKTLRLVLVSLRGGQFSSVHKEIVWEIMKTNLVDADCVAFNDAQIVNELMEFIYDYSDFELEEE